MTNKEFSILCCYFAKTYGAIEFSDAFIIAKYYFENLKKHQFLKMIDDYFKSENKSRLFDILFIGNKYVIVEKDFEIRKVVLFLKKLKKHPFYFPLTFEEVKKDIKVSFLQNEHVLNFVKFLNDNGINDIPSSFFDMINKGEKINDIFDALFKIVGTLIEKKTDDIGMYLSKIIHETPLQINRGFTSLEISKKIDPDSDGLSLIISSTIEDLMEKTNMSIDEIKCIIENTKMPKKAKESLLSQVRDVIYEERNIGKA